MNSNLNTKIDMRLKDSVIAEIKKNKALVRALEDLFDRTPFTVMQWIRQNNPMLCHISALQIIAAYLKKEMDDLIEKTEADFINIT